MAYFDAQFSLITGYRFLLKQIISFISEIDLYCNQKGQKLLDIGCGNKPYQKFFRNYQYTGMDLYNDISSPDIVGDIMTIPVENNSVDAVMTVWVLDDIPEPWKAVAEIARILKPGGYYFAVENQSTNQHFKEHDYFRFTPLAMEFMAKSNQMKMIRCESYGGDFALTGFTLITAFNTMFNRILGSNNFFRPVYSTIINLFFFPLDRFFRIDFFRRNFEKNSLGYCYVFQKFS